MLIDLTKRVKKLEKLKMTCDWSEVEAIQKRIDECNYKISQGIMFEPAF